MHPTTLTLGVGASSVPAASTSALPSVGPETLLAQLLDVPLAPNQGPLSQALSRGETLRGAVAGLSAAQRRSLETRWGAAGLEELLTLGTERDRELFGESLLSLAARQETLGRSDLAAELYQGLGARATAGAAADGVESGPRAVAQRRLDALLGRGAFGLRSEYLLRNLAPQACDPTALLAMGVAGSVFRLTRLATLSRLAASPTANFLTRGFGARAVAGLAGFALEAPAFTLSGRLTAEALGHRQDWSAAALRRDLASSFLVLGGLKAAGVAGAGLYRRFGGSNELARGLFTQGSMLTGIVGAHWLETQAGLRPATPGATTLVDSLALLLQFNVAGRLTQQAFGPRVAAWERTLELQTELLARENFRAAGPRGPGLGWTPALAAAPAGGETGRRGADELLNGMQVLMSKMDDDGRGGRGPEWHSVPVGEGREETFDPTTVDRQISTLLLAAGDNLELGLRQFIERLPMATAVARLERGDKNFGRIFMVNRSFRELFGYNEAEIGELPLMQFFNPLKSAFIFARIWNIFRQGIFNPSDMELRHISGSWVKIRGSGVVKDLGEHSIAFGFLEPRERAGREATAQRQILDAFKASKRERPLQADADGLIEVDSVLELSTQLTRNDSELMRRIEQQDVRIRIANMPWSRAPEDNADPLRRFFNGQARRFEFPVGRRVSVEFPATADRPRVTLSFIKWEEGFRVMGLPNPEGNGGTPSTPRVSASIAAPPMEAPTAIAPSPVLDNATANLIAGLHGELNTAVTAVKDRIAKQDMEIPVAGTYPRAFLVANQEGIQTELQAITERRIPVTLGRQLTLVFQTDQGPVSWVFRKVLRRFERVQE